MKSILYALILALSIDCRLPSEKAVSLRRRSSFSGSDNDHSGGDHSGSDHHGESHSDDDHHGGSHSDDDHHGKSHSDNDHYSKRENKKADKHVMHGNTEITHFAIQINRGNYHAAIHYFNHNYQHKHDGEFRSLIIQIYHTGIETVCKFLSQLKDEKLQLLGFNTLLDEMHKSKNVYTSDIISIAYKFRRSITHNHLTVDEKEADKLKTFIPAPILDFVFGSHECYIKNKQYPGYIADSMAAHTDLQNEVQFKQTSLPPEASKWIFKATNSGAKFEIISDHGGLLYARNSRTVLTQFESHKSNHLMNSEWQLEFSPTGFHIKNSKLDKFLAIEPPKRGKVYNVVLVDKDATSKAAAWEIKC